MAKGAIDQARFSKKITDADENAKINVGLTLVQCPVTDEQMAKLLSVLDDAASSAASVMGW